VKKAHIDVQRVLCTACWRARHALQERIAACEAQWAASKQALARDAVFVSAWHALLVEHQHYGARANRAALAMLQHLLERIAQDGLETPSQASQVGPAKRSLTKAD
jgi:hypothetical protein